MILCDRDIQQAIEDGRLEIGPVPSEDRYGTTSVDLTLDSEFLKWDLTKLQKQFGNTPPIDIESYDYRALAEAYLQPIPLDDDGCAIIHAQEFVLAQTRETVGFPVESRLAGRVEGKSSLARLGLSVHFAPTLHAGWRGHITLELHNVGEAPLRLRPGARVCQLLVEPVSGGPLGSMDGTRFQDQSTPRGSSQDSA